MPSDFGNFGGPFGGGGGSYSGWTPRPMGGWGGAIDKSFGNGSLQALAPQGGGWGGMDWLKKLFGGSSLYQSGFAPMSESFSRAPMAALSAAAAAPKANPYTGGLGPMSVSPMVYPKANPYVGDYGSMQARPYPMAAPRPAAPAPFRGDGLGLAGLRYGQTTPGAAQATGAGQSYGNYMEDAMKALFARR